VERVGQVNRPDGGLWRSVLASQPYGRIRREQSVLLVVDVQERLLPMIDGQEGVLAAAGRMVRVAEILGIPILCTEQYPRGLGPTVEPLRSLIGAERTREKVAFSCCGAEGLLDGLGGLGRPQVVVVGIEAHVCVQQTVLDLLAAGYRTYVAADAVSSRYPLDRDVAFERMRQAGAVVTTTESVMFEWLEVAGTPEFKQVSRIVKER